MKNTLSLPLSLLVVLAAGCASAPKDGSAATSFEKSFSWKQMRLSYRDIPAAQPGGVAIVFVHCWTCDGGFWREQIPALQGRARLLVIDLPGHGASEKPEIEYSMDLFARAVEAGMRDAGVEKAVLVGHSMGVPVIRQFYRHFPEKVRALIAVDGALRPFLTDPEQIDGFLSRFDGPLVEENVRVMVDSMFPATASVSLRDSVKATMASAPAQVRKSAMKGMMDASIWREDSIEVPLLVINAKSNFWPADYESFVRRLAPECDFRAMEGVGHFLMLENPSAFNTILLDFLQARNLIR